MKTALRLALALYPPWWRHRYGREMDALLEDSGAGWREVFDLARGALVVRIKALGGHMQRGFVEAAFLLGRNALAFTMFWLMAFAFMRAGHRIAGWPGSESGVTIASVLGIVISYRLRASAVAVYLGGLAGFTGSYFLIGTPVVLTDRQAGASLIEHGSVIAAEYAQEIQLLRIVLAIVMATLVWQAVRRRARASAVA